MRLVIARNYNLSGSCFQVLLN